MPETTAKVQAQYEAFPYPLRNPDDERTRIIRTDLDDLHAVNHHCFAGRRRFDEPFRVLVAGGGTGDAIIYMVHQLRETPAELVYLDISQASQHVARERAKVRGLEHRITWIHANLLDLPHLGLGRFDYINCSGVLHHLANPAAGLRALTSVLADDGAMGLMLYGQYGRTGVYQMQDLLRLLVADRSLEDRVEIARVTLREAPPTNWYKRGWGTRLVRYELDDVELVDMFLHPQDRAYTVPQLYDLIEGEGLRMVAFTADQRLFYDLRYVVQSKELRTALEGLGERSRQAAAELFHGVIGMHTFWVSRRGPHRPEPVDAEMVPFFSHSALEHGLPEIIRGAGGQAWMLKLGPEGTPQIGFTVRPDAVGQRFLERIDGVASLGEIRTSIVEELGLGEAAVGERVARMMRQMMACDLVLLRHRSVAALPQEH